MNKTVEAAMSRIISLEASLAQLQDRVVRLAAENAQLRQSYEDCEVRNMALVAAARTNKEETQ